MKKLMVAAAIVCAAVMAQASTFQWGTKSTGTTGVIWDGTSLKNAKATYGQVAVYLLDSATYSTSDAFTALKAGTFDASKAISTTTLSTASKITAKNFEYGTIGKTYDMYFVSIFDDDPNTFYMSSVKTGNMALESGTTALEWTDVAGNSKTTLKAADGYQGAGVYTAVPEPTSGLLLLLGVAGMALRRRRA